MGVFLTGLIGSGVALVPALYPAETYQTWCRLRYGAVPSGQGLLVTLGPAPPELEGDVLLELRNVGGQATTVFYAERMGEEIELEVRDSAGRLLERRAGPELTTRVSAIHRAVLPPRGEPGGRLAFVVDVSSRVKVPAPGRYTVVATRVPFAGDRHSCRSNSAEVLLD